MMMLANFVSGPDSLGLLALDTCIEASAQPSGSVFVFMICDLRFLSRPTEPAPTTAPVDKEQAHKQR